MTPERFRLFYEGPVFRLFRRFFDKELARLGVLTAPTTGRQVGPKKTHQPL